MFPLDICFLLATFYDFLIRHSKKNVKSQVFLKSEKRQIRMLEHWRPYSIA